MVIKHTNKSMLFSLVIFLVFVYASATPANESRSDVNQLDGKGSESNVVDVNLAIFVAEDYLPAFYPGNWKFFSHLVYYDLDGFPAAYAIIFRDVNSSIETEEKLTTWLEKASNYLDQIDKQLRVLNDSRETPQEDKDKLVKERKAQRTGTLRKSYRTRDFATVVTGATNESKVLTRCYKGLPSVLVNKSKLKKQLLKKYPDKELELGQILYLGQGNISYEVLLATTSEQYAEEQIPAESYLISPKDEQLVSILKYRGKMQKLQAEKKAQIEKLKPNMKELLEQGEENRILHNKGKWAEYEQMYLEELEKQQDGEGEK